ncbi:MAG: TlpA family protein disulfide reductase [Ilumatobacteraceae bacterium]
MPTNRRLLIASLIWTLILSLTIGWWWSAHSTPGVDAILTTPGLVPYPTIGTNDDLIGRELPSISIVSLDGTQMSTSDLLGTPLLINFWFSTCEPCRREMPTLAAAYRQYGDSIRFVGLNMNDSAAVARAFAKQYGVTYELFTEPSGVLITELGIATAPFTVFINSDGDIVAQFAGELTASTLDALISEAFPT